MMRVILYEAAQSMLRSKKWSWLKAWAMQIARRRGMKKAIVVSIGVGMGPPVLPHLRMLPVGCLRTLADGPTLRAGTGRGAVGGSGRA